MTTSSDAGFARRDFLRGGLGATLLAGTGATAALLSGCSRRPMVAQGYQVLHAHHLPLLQRMIPVVIGEGVSADNRDADIALGVRAFDRLLADTSPAVREAFSGMLDLLTTPLTRGPLFGQWRSWEQAGEDDARAVLEEWRGTSIGLLRGAFNAFTQIIAMSWYLDDAHNTGSFYPGPPRKVVIDNAGGAA